MIVAKRLLASLAPGTLAAARMGLGTLVLLGWLAVSGRGGELFALGAEQWSWAIVTGLLLTGYVATWYAALARAQAVDVTAVLVFGAVVTALLGRLADGVSIDVVGVVLVSLGAAIAGAAALRAGAEVGVTPGPLLFARYAYPPNALGLCGTEETRLLLEYASAGPSTAGWRSSRARSRAPGRTSS